MSKTQMQTATESFVVHYPEAIKFQEDQLSIFWLPDEPKVEKDIQDVLVNMTEAERHGVITTLKLFSLYELIAGNEYWGGRYARMFPRPELLRMASVFSMFELAIHAPFYNKLNELLHLNTDEFYTDYVNDPKLKARMDFIDSAINDEDDLISIGTFSMVEGVILYSNFSYLKHFQSQGKNKLMNVVRGINFSVRDENIHSIAGAWSFKKLMQEKNITPEEKDNIKNKLVSVAEKLYEHECLIIDMIFEKGAIEGITSTQMKHFVQSRINLCMKELGFNNVYEVPYNPISDWFYDGINGFQYNDFFTGIGASYNRNWDASSFVWKNYEKEEKVAA